MRSWVSARPAWLRVSGERRAREHETDRVRQTQTARRERDQDRKAEQAQRAKQENVHAPCLAARPQKAKPRGLRYCAAARSAPARR